MPTTTPVSTDEEHADPPADVADADATETDRPTTEETSEDPEEVRPREPRFSRLPQVSHGTVCLIVAVLCVALVTGLVAMLGVRADHARDADRHRQLFLQIGRKVALNLTTISYTEVDADIQRVLDSSTGAFYDEFKERSKAFADLIRQTQTTTIGSVTEVGIQSIAGDRAEVLAATSVKTTTAGAESPMPRHWRMRMLIEAVDDTAKVSRVEFVP